jgi:hypothetical protein
MEKDRRVGESRGESAGQRRPNVDAEVTPVPEAQMVKEAASLSLSRFELTVTLDSESNPTLSSLKTSR